MNGIIPPRLNQKFIYCGFQAIEIFTIIGVFVFFLLIGNPKLMVLPAGAIVLLVRFDGEHNLLYKFKTLYNYYARPQIFTSKGVKAIYEKNSADN